MGFLEKFVALVFKKRRFIVYPRFQLKLIRLIALTTGLIFVPHGILNYFFYKRIFSRMTSLNLTADEHEMFKDMILDFVQLYGATAMAMSAMVSICTLVAVFLSHRLVGPLVRFEKVLNDYAETGEIAPVQTRKDDFLKTFTETFNRAVNRINNKSNEQQ